jgi:signal recognition particle receptor subunit beta
VSAPPPTDTAQVSLKTRFLEVATDYLNFDSGSPAESQARKEAFGPIVEAITMGVFRIVAMGEVKKGKSSFINALLGLPGLLPTDSDVATSTVYKVVYGPAERITVFFEASTEDPTTSKAPLDIRPDQLADYGTEKGNPDNGKQVDFIAIQTPSPLLKQGLVIVDTPGVGGLFKRHREITFRYAPSADVILFLVDSVESVIGQDEVSFLHELRKQTTQVVFVQTKSDMASQEQTAAWKARNLEIIAKALELKPEAIPYFVVSSQLKNFAEETQSLDVLHESGFPEFLRYFQNALLPHRDRLLLARWLPPLQATVQCDKKLIADRWRIAQQSQNRPLLEKYHAELKQAEEAFSRWQNDTWPTLQRDYRNTVAQLDRASFNSIEDATLPENTIPPLLNDLKERCKSPDQILAAEESLRAEHASRCNSDVNAIITNYQHAFVEVFKRTEVDTWSSLRGIQPPSVMVESRTAADVDASTFRTMRETYMGTMFVQSLGRRLATVGGGGLAVLVGAGVLTMGVAVVASMVGGLALVANEIWSYVRGYKQSRERQANEALRALENAMAKTCHVANRAGRRELNNLSAEMKSSAEEAFFAFQKQFRADYEDRRKEIELARSQTVEESKATVEQLSRKAKAIESIHRSLEEIASQVRRA